MKNVKRIYEKTLSYYRINEKYLDLYVDCFFGMIQSFNEWLELTGDEFIIDNKKIIFAGHSVLFPTFSYTLH